MTTPSRGAWHCKGGPGTLPPRPPTRAPARAARSGSRPSREHILSPHPRASPHPPFPAGPDLPGDASWQRFNGRVDPGCMRSLPRPRGDGQSAESCSTLKVSPITTHCNPERANQDDGLEHMPSRGAQAGESRRGVDLRRHADSTYRHCRRHAGFGGGSLGNLEAGRDGMRCIVLGHEPTDQHQVRTCPVRKAAICERESWGKDQFQWTPVCRCK